MKYQVFENEVFLGIYDTTTVSRENVECMEFMSYWVISYTVWNSEQYRRVYALCRELNRMVKIESEFTRYRMSLAAAARHLHNAYNILGNPNEQNPSIQP